MFWRKKNEEKKEKRMIDKVVMGAIIGGAIGSVVGASLAPKEGKETRKDIKEAATKAVQQSGNIINKLKHIFFKEKIEQKEIPHEAPQEKR